MTVGAGVILSRLLGGSRPRSWLIDFLRFLSGMGYVVAPPAHSRAAWNMWLREPHHAG